MLIYLDSLEKIPDGEKFCIVAFFSKLVLSHTGFYLKTEEGEDFVISRYGNENGIYISRFENVREFYGEEFLYFRIQPEKIKIDFADVLKKINTYLCRKLMRLDNKILRKIKELTLTSSHFLESK